MSAAQMQEADTASPRVETIVLGVVGVAVLFLLPTIIWSCSRLVARHRRSRRRSVRSRRVQPQEAAGCSSRVDPYLNDGCAVRPRHSERSTPSPTSSDVARSSATCAALAAASKAEVSTEARRKSRDDEQSRAAAASAERERRRRSSNATEPEPSCCSSPTLSARSSPASDSPPSIPPSALSLPRAAPLVPLPIIPHTSALRGAVGFADGVRTPVSPAASVPLPLGFGRPPSIAALAAEAASDGRATWVSGAVARGPLGAVGAALPGLLSVDASRGDHHALPSAAYHGPQPRGSRIHPAEAACAVARTASLEYSAERSHALAEASRRSAEAPIVTHGRSAAAEDREYRLAIGLGKRALAPEDEALLLGSASGGGGDEAGTLGGDVQFGDMQLVLEKEDALGLLEDVAPLVLAALQALANATADDVTSDDSELRFVATALTSLSQRGGIAQQHSQPRARRPTMSSAGRRGQSKGYDARIASMGARALLDGLVQQHPATLSRSMHEALRDAVVHVLTANPRETYDGPGGPALLAEALAERFTQPGVGESQDSHSDV